MFAALPHFPIAEAHPLKSPWFFIIKIGFKSIIGNHGDYIDQLIKTFGKSRSYYEARKRWEEVQKFTEQINEKQVNDIALAIIDNDQIYDQVPRPDGVKNLKSFLKEHKDQILPETIQKLEDLTGWKIAENN
jgi:hypothetical protein